MKRTSTWIAAGALVVAAGLALAQVPREPAPGAREPAPGAREPAPGLRDPARPAANTQASRGDQELAAVMLACCRNEVELAKLAQQKAQSEEVRQFAEKMFKEHSEACTNLEKWAGPLAAARPVRGEPEARPAPGADPEARAPRAAPGADVEVRVPPGTRPGAEVTVRGDRAPLNWVSIHQQIADQCLASAKKEFSQKEGEEFDKCYIGMAIGAHFGAIDAEKVFLNHASQQFRGEIEEGLKTASIHLNEAKDIMQKLDGKSPRLSQKPDALKP